MIVDDWMTHRHHLCEVELHLNSVLQACKTEVQFCNLQNQAFAKYEFCKRQGRRLSKAKAKLQFCFCFCFCNAVSIGLKAINMWQCMHIYQRCIAHVVCTRDSGRLHVWYVSSAYVHLQFMSQAKRNLSFRFFCVALHFPLLSAPSLRFSLIYVNEDPCISYIHSFQSRYFCNSLINQPTPLSQFTSVPIFKKNGKTILD